MNREDPDHFVNKVRSDVSDLHMELLHHDTPSDIIQRILEDIEESCLHGNRDHGDTLFYKIVQGGNVEIIAEVLQQLKTPGHAKMRAWLLDQELDSDLLESQKRPSGPCQCLVRSLAFLFLSVIYVLVTPVFYLLHGLLTSIWSKYSSNSCELSSFPLSMIFSSKSAAMIELFHKEGLDIWSVDRQGNNIVHHIAARSTDDPKGAMVMWRHLTAIYCGANFALLCSKTNKMGLTPVEYAAKHGSLLFLNCLLDSEYLWKTTKLYADSSHVTLHGTYQESVTSICNQHHKIKQGLTEAEYDVTHYENGALLRTQSTLLSILSSRDSLKEESSHTELLVGGSFLSIWIKRKINSLTILRYVSNLYGVVLTCFVVAYMVITGGDNNQYPLAAKSSNIYFAAAGTEILKVNPKADIYAYSMSDIGYFCYMPNITFEGLKINDWCREQALHKLTEECRHEVTAANILRDTASVLKTDTEFLALVFRAILVTIMGLYMLYDIMMRLVFLYKNICSSNWNIKTGIKRSLVLKIPGSYLSKQLTVLSICLFSSSIVVTHFMLYFAVTYLINIDKDMIIKDYISILTHVHDLSLVISYTTSLAMTLRMISFAYTLRLVPLVGHFLLLTFKMTAILCSFLVVYFIILISFSSLFHFLLRDPACPSLRLSNYQTLTESGYQTFLMLLGLTDFPEDHSSMARAAYIFYLLICSIVLLNLIIAMMTGVVDENNAHPTQAVIHLREHLGDALAAETWLLLAGCPWGARVHRALLGRAGYVITQTKDSKLRCGQLTHRVCINMVHRT